MIVGALEIQMAADMARLSKDLQAGRAMLTTFASDADRAASRVKAALGGVSVAGFTALVNGTIDAMDHLNDLAKSTNQTVETLAGMSIAAKQSGTDLGTLTGSIDKLTVNIGKNREAFALLGITTKDPLEAMKQLSDLFVALPDPMQRNAVMAQAFGKGWKEIAPLLAEGSTRIGEMIDKGSQLSGITSGMAQQADAFNDKLVLLKDTHGLWNREVGAALPLLNQLADDLLKIQAAASQEGNGGGFSILAETLRALVVIGGNVVFVLKGIGTEIGGIGAQVAALANGDFARAGEIHRQMIAEAETARVKFDAWESSIMNVGTATAATTAAVDAGDQVTRRAASNAAAAARAFLQAEKDKNDAAELEKAFQRELAAAMTALTAARAEALNGTDSLTASQRKLIALANDPTFKKILPTEQQTVIAVLNRAAAQEKLNAQVKLYAEIAAKAIEEDERFQQEWSELMSRGEDSIQQLQDQIDLEHAETQALGLSRVERDVLLLNLKREQELRGVVNDATRAGINLKYDELAAAVRNRAAMEEQLAMWGKLGDVAGDFFADLITHGKSAFDHLKQYAKDLLAELIKVFAKRWILQMAAGATGSSALASQAAGVGTNSLAGTAMSAAGNYVSGLSVGGTVVGGTADFAAGWSAAGAGIEMGAIEGGTWMTTLGYTLAEIPVWGWIAAAVLALAAHFAGGGGGPKGGGSFGGTFSGAGDFLGASSIPGTQDGRLFTPNNADASIQQFVQGMGRSFGDALRALGGTSGGVNFGLGFDTDPHGRAPDRVSSTVSDLSGNILYQNINQNTGDSLEGAMSLEAQRMILAALQASTLPTQVADILNTISAQTATADQIQAVIAAATEMANVIKALPALGMNIDIAGLQAFQASGESIGQTFNRLAQTMATFDDQFMTDAQKFDRAQKQVTDAFHQLGIAIPANKTEFYDLVHGLDLTTEAGRAMFVVLMQVAPAFLQVQTAVADTADAITTAAVQMSQAQAYILTGQADFDAVVASRDADKQHDAMAQQLRGWLAGLLTNGSLSTLSPMEQLAAAKKQYQDAVTVGTDANAISGAGNTYLQIARQLFGSTSAYVDIFQGVYNAVAGVAGGKDYNTQMIDIQQRALALQQQVSDTLAKIRQESREDMDYLVQEQRANTDRLVTAVSTKEAVYR